MGQTEKKTIEDLAAQAVRELDAIRHPGAGAKAKEWMKSLTGRGNALGQDPVFWPAGLLLLGLTEAGYTREAEEYLDTWIRRGCVVQNPDDALTGTVALRLYERTGRDCYRAAADKVAAYLHGCLRDENGSVIYGQRSGNEWIYADGAGMTAMFLARYGRDVGAADGAYSCPGSDFLKGQAGEKDGKEYLKGHSAEKNAKEKPAARDAEENGREENRLNAVHDARRQLVNYAALGMDARSGLPYHGYEAASGVKLGIIGWGRAVGWLLLGLSEYIIQAGTAMAEKNAPSNGAGAGLADMSERAAALHGESAPAGGERQGRTVDMGGETESGESDKNLLERRDEFRTGLSREDEIIFRMTRELCRAVTQRIRPDGMLSWQLDCAEGPLDTSATGMIFYSLLRLNRFVEAQRRDEGDSRAAASGERTPAGFTDPSAAETDRAAAKKPSADAAWQEIPCTDPALIDAAAQGLYDCIDQNGCVLYSSAECVDFAQYRQQYGTYPWGQGAVLAFLALYEAV